MAAKINSKTRQLTEGPLLPQILRFALPMMATSVLQLLFNTADTIVVGRWGGDTQEACETALAAVGSCGALIMLLVNLFMGMSMGTGVCVAQAMGARTYDKVQKLVHAAVPLGFCCGCFLTVLGFLFAEPLLLLMGTEPQILCFLQNTLPGHMMQMIVQCHGMGDDLESVVQRTVVLAVSIIRRVVGDMQNLFRICVSLTGFIDIQLHAEKAFSISMEDGLRLVVVFVNLVFPAVIQIVKAVLAVGSIRGSTTIKCITAKDSISAVSAKNSLIIKTVAAVGIARKIANRFFL